MFAQDSQDIFKKLTADIEYTMLNCKNEITFMIILFPHGEICINQYNYRCNLQITYQNVNTEITFGNKQNVSTDRTFGKRLKEVLGCW
jgi:hypothetical protein